MVETALHHFAGERYLLGEYIVMPNHVHLIVMPLEKRELSDILQSWKSFTAKKINRLTGEKGVFWQKESYDHLIRDEAALWETAEYIRNNPGHISTDQ